MLSSWTALAVSLEDEEEVIKQQLVQEKLTIQTNNKDINDKQNEKRALIKDKNEKSLSLQKLNQDLQTINHNLKTNQEMVNKLMNENKWIKQESIFFAKPNTIYDFNSMNIKEMEVKLVSLKDKKQQLSRIVNNKALVMLESVEEKYKELMNKKMTLLADKRKIEELIKQLDSKKCQTIQKAYVQVNKDFGSIFSTLLPGSYVKLTASEGQTILQGLEIKVSFNDIWIESLTELSGGQRSLIALSLILALLLFKPAPIYILDEIDAALDASHTQNIGIMLSRHFKKSQFIVVSLKDGMFQNANVLFKTALVEGGSTVSRYTKSA
ncbi:structural maintenance of chromosomes protein 2-like [Gordionus sp. m RMFG-2023]|uniref:structural maintenance of chromosomes protein 2-like n=1 Tax=Gordionus sp. m RMFG-2023 TaxID=3053472 RepID=UPI0031FCB7ED